MSEYRRVREIVQYSTKGITPKYVEKSSVMVLNQKCIRNNSIDYFFAQYTNDRKPIPIDKIIKSGDILINSTGQGTAGRCAFVNKIPKNVSLTMDSHILLLRCKSYHEAQCLSYSLFSIEKTMQSFMDGSTGQGELDKVRLFNLLTTVPSDPVIQQKIAAVLSSLDAKIELNNHINTQLEAMAKTLYDYWFVQFDFPDDNGKPYKSSDGKMIWNETLKRKVPEVWKVRNLDFIANIIGGSTPSKENEKHFSKEGIPWITPKDLSLNTGNKFITNGEIDVTELGKRAASLTILPRGTILMSSRAPIGYLAIARNEVTTNQGFKSFVPKSYFPSEYIYYTIKNLLPVIENNASGSTFKEISGSVLKTIYLPIPTEETAALFKSKVLPIFKRQEILEEENMQLTKLRDWLLPMLMNGQLKVAEDMEEHLSMAAEPAVPYHVQSKSFDIPERKKTFAKQVLGGKIVSLFMHDPHFTHIKFQKLQYLAEHIAEADLHPNYYFQAAGPYDNVFMHTIAHKFRQSRWFDEQEYRFIPLEKQSQIEEYYTNYFAPVSERLSQLFSLLADVTEAEAEIIATLYAVWNNRIILKQPVTQASLIEDFYNWSDRKHKYLKEQVLEGLQWLTTNKMEPSGFGKVIKRAKVEKKI